MTKPNGRHELLIMGFNEHHELLTSGGVDVGCYEKLHSKLTAPRTVSPSLEVTYDNAYEDKTSTVRNKLAFLEQHEVFLRLQEPRSVKVQMAMEAPHPSLGCRHVLVN